MLYFVALDPPDEKRSVGVCNCVVFNRYCSKPFDELLVEHFTKHIDFFNF